MNEDCSYTVFDESTWISLSEVCRFCRVDHQHIQEMIQEGVLAPTGTSPQDWRFGVQELKRIQITIRLQQDLGVNLPGAALALDLLEELELLRNLTKNLDIAG
ncbi:MAG: chaperone modulator CbpM [Desulfocapsaceae bacterium]|nr:chaperone modulator CbpM [Desulfocapsaceae bacterium]